MKIYTYDGSFSSLLELITFLIETKRKPDDIQKEIYEPSLLDEVMSLQLIPRKNLFSSWQQKIGVHAFRIAFYVYLSEEKRKELILFYYFLNALKYREKIIYMRNLKCVNVTLKISGHVSHEIHKLKGFLRFKETKNKFLYAEVEPTNDILYFLAEHFRERLKNENYLILDKKRKKVCMYDAKKIYFLKEEDFLSLNLELETEEKNIQDLWKTFFDTIAIQERRNEKCQRSFMPKKYWKYMIEMESKQ